jgi:tRNA-2-methylthio-N6-dimethylallyladenosine synthase
MGKSPWLQSVHLPANPRLIGEMIEVKITGAQLNSLSGEMVLPAQAEGL